MRSLQRITDSILAVDIGSTWTRALLFDRVDGQQRFVAQGEALTTVRPPHGDLGAGMRAAIRQLEARAGRTLLDEEGALISPEDAAGRGVDMFVSAASAAPPLRVAVGGLAARLSVASARRAALGSYSTILHTFALDTPEGRWGHPQGVAGVADLLLRDRPDAIILAGGTEHGTSREMLELVDAIRLMLAVPAEGDEPLLIWAGATERADEAALRLGTRGRFLVSENVRPTIEQEQVRTASRLLEQTYRSRRLNRLPGHELLSSWNSQETISTAEALSRVVQYLALRHEQRVLAVDVGSRSTILSTTFPNRVTQTLVRTDLGIGSRAAHLFDTIGLDALVRWVPGSTPPEALHNLWLNLALHPAQKPTSEDALHLLQGAGRSAIARILADAMPIWEPTSTGGLPPFDLILGGGRVLREVARPEQAAALLLDALQPIGVVQLMRDQLGLVPAIGALSGAVPAAAAELVDHQGFESLGVAVAPLGAGTPGEEALRFRLEQPNGVTEGTIEWGQSYRFPALAPTTLTLRPAGHVDLGKGAGTPLTLSREGDHVGFLIDARGRPLPHATTLSAQRQQAEEWIRYVGA